MGTCHPLTAPSVPHPDNPDDSHPDETSRWLVYFAAERTLTSWIRTALSLMALGFVIDRFDLVLRHVGDTAMDDVLSPRALWQWGGSLVIATGALIALAAGIWYWRFALRCRDESSVANVRGLVAGSLFSLMLGLAGLLLIGMLTILW